MFAEILLSSNVKIGCLVTFCIMIYGSYRTSNFAAGAHRFGIGELKDFVTISCYNGIPLVYDRERIKVIINYQ